MRTWQVTKLGDPTKVVAQTDIPEPQRSGDELLVQIQAVGLGFPDFLMAQGLYHDKPDLPFGIGGESSGLVLEAPAGSDFAAGDHVLTLAGKKGGVVLTNRVAAAPERLLKVPTDMLPEHAAVLFSGYQTSYVGLMRRGHLEAGQTVVIHGASGGVGMAAVQIAKAKGAKVIAVAGGQRKVDACREWGADVVIDHQKEDFVEVVKDLTNGRGVEIFDKSRRIMAVEGRLVVVGFAGGTIPSAPANHVLLKNYDVVGMRMRPFREDPVYRQFVHDELVQMYQDGALKPRISKYGFDDLPAALDEIGTRQVIGRVVVSPPPEN